ncbi:hypothetical protein H012_gp663 [Acanthamoeba polyphaga moumouvirus]|uniref:Uncharacterized protein n=2 Tax=Moumouvirus TaxID=3080801 RepID=L7RC23_9VIRU|nr:hypothetical protein H012_gp663 [Acanthamoeba polyphaga moumouvirus]AEX63008.1 hypothetical protein mv_R806 [Moumouvirus Monve]AGC01802.1 hypothetical protein Moumou_00258 [Acanthamoeba polyphaga moumouvirus]AQN68151.1 hypothetical protein [Saudi moumouvirus]
MSTLNYSIICNHSRLERIDNNFVRCLSCGQSLISQKTITNNKRVKDFTKENNNFTRNFNRNFSNQLEQLDANSQIPKYEYYTDKFNANLISINKAIQLLSDPPKYEIDVNGSKNYLTQAQINNILKNINAIRIDYNQYMMIKLKHPKQY